ncbi:MAG: glycosyltransferase family 39 protein [Bacteroidales bacterium]|jgi:4-amino-4-deoxy-L-arabinose transferase|nr:glycosyltransferase family 39 protein [Bacteroidales bacterium]
MIQTHFSDLQVFWIFLALLSGLTSIILFLNKKPGYSLLFLVISGVILRIMAAGLDPFLYTWDEQFHALVAKNMMHQPFKPMLIVNPVLDYDYQSWISNHIWLHKQPWFLWQIALFFKMFGVNEFVLRLPTALMFSLLIPIIYRIGKLLTNPEIAWCGAFIYTFSYFFINFISGITFTDHNDGAFVFYIALSLWAWAEYNHSGKRKWIYLIGIFAGIAIMNKWLAGLLIYSGWFLSVFAKSGKKKRIQELKNIAIALICTLAVALPWQIYIMMAFPKESQYVFLFNSRHLMDPLEAHSENRWYHFYLLSQQYGGILVYFVILPGLYYFVNSLHNKETKIAVITWIAVTYIFFTVVASKMPMFCTIVSPLIFLGLGAILEKGIQKFREYLPSRKYLFIAVLLLFYLDYDNLSINDLDNIHSDKHANWKEWKTKALIDKYVAKRIPSKDYVIFNSGRFNAIMLMFYSENTAYGYYPDKRQYEVMKSAGVKMATFVDENMPDYMKKDTAVYRIYLQVKPY